MSAFDDAKMEKPNFLAAFQGGPLDGQQSLVSGEDSIDWLIPVNAKGELGKADGAEKYQRVVYKLTSQGTPFVYTFVSSKDYSVEDVDSKKR